MLGSKEIQEYLTAKKKLHQYVLDYFMNENDSYIILTKEINDQNISQNKTDMMELLQMISKISINIHNNPSLYDRIVKILQFLQNDMKKMLSSSKIFKIFKCNKKILLYLFKENILSPDQSIANVLTSKKYKNMNYVSYFYPELKQFIDQKKESNNHHQSDPPEDYGKYYNEDPNEFEKKRQIGENEDYICHLIRNDLIDDFVIYITKTSKSLKSTIQQSIYETNSFLMNKNPTFIEYATFFGSIQIFKYLQLNNIDFTTSLWMYAIHGNNPEIIHILEENHIMPNDNNEFYDCYIEAIKCHHNKIADYLCNVYDANIRKREEEEEKNKSTKVFDVEERDWWMKIHEYNTEEEEEEYIDDINDDDEKIIDTRRNLNIPYLYFKYFNYEYIDDNMLNDQMVYLYICKYNYASLFSILFNISKIQVNNTNNENIDPLFYAIKRENNEIVKLLISNDNFDVNKKLHMEKAKIIPIKIYSSYHNMNLQFIYEEDNKTPIYIAAENNNIEIVKLLLKIPNIDVNLSSKTKIWRHNGYTKYINEYKLINLMKWWKNKIHEGFLLDGCEDRKELVFESYPLNISIEKGNNEIVNLLLSNLNININLKSIEKIWNYSAREGRRYGGEYTEEYQRSSLYTAVNNDNIEIVRLLLKFPSIEINDITINKTTRIDIEYHSSKSLTYRKNEQSVLNLSIKNNNFEIFELLISHPKIKINQRLNKTLREIRYETEMYRDYYEIHNWRIEDRFKYIQYDNEINKRGIYDDEIKHYYNDIFLSAVKKGNLKVVKILASKPEIDICSVYDGNKNSFHIAVQKKYKDIVEFLLSLHKFDINAKMNYINAVGTKETKTPLHIAIEQVTNDSDRNKVLDIINLLLKQPDLDINATIYDKYSKGNITALDLAVKRHCVDVVKLLISHPKIDTNNILNTINANLNDIQKMESFKCKEMYQKSIQKSYEINEILQKFI